MIPTSTDREKALKKTDELFDIAEEHRLCDPNHCHCWDKFAAALAEAREEGMNIAIKCQNEHDVDFLDEGKKLGYAEGYAKAVEDAAKVCETHSDDNAWGLAKAIRGLKV